jgi:hypothetical protein
MPSPDLATPLMKGAVGQFPTLSDELVALAALLLRMPEKGSRVACPYEPRHQAPCSVRVPSLPTLS